MGIFSDDEKHEQFIEQTFEQELRQLINKYSIENQCDIPDFLLAEMIVTVVESVGPVFKKVLDWHSVCHSKAQEHKPKAQKGYTCPNCFCVNKRVKDCWTVVCDYCSTQFFPQKETFNDFIRKVGTANVTLRYAPQRDTFFAHAAGHAEKEFNIKTWEEV